MNPTSRYQFFTAKSLKPHGWLKRQLEIQANGLAGNLDLVWPDIRDSRWIGGKCEGWERVPYWLDGFLPLAYLLENEDMIRRANRFVDSIIASQQPDGWICPCAEEERPAYDMWALLLMGKVLVLHYECSGDQRVPGVLLKAFRQFTDHLKKYPLFNWGKFRWYEGMITVEFLRKFTQELWLDELAKMLRDQGYDYEAMFRDWHCTMPERRWTFETHVVNHAMAIKQQAVDPLAPADLAELMYSTLMRDHGMPNGHFSGDECLAGLSPIQGTELCGVAEAMYSVELLAARTGNPVIWGDRLERLAFNAYPATVSDDMWSHQYDQQTNQIGCVREAKSIYHTNRADANIFGLEPNYGCCTANMGQAWPKFALSAWLWGAEDELFNLSPVPSVLETAVKGTSVKITTQSEYPFRDGAVYEVECTEPVEFALSIRIPGFAASAKVDGQIAEPGMVYTIRRKWQGKVQITLELAFDAVMAKRPADMRCVYRGSLLFALPIQAEVTRMEYVRKDRADQKDVERKYPYCDYELQPVSKWNYGFLSDEFSVTHHAVPEIPFSGAAPAITLTAKMAEVQWETLEGYRAIAAPQPVPQRYRTALPDAEPEELQLIPYGAAKLRMTEMPLVKMPEK